MRLKTVDAVQKTIPELAHHYGDGCNNIFKWTLGNSNSLISWMSSNGNSWITHGSFTGESCVYSWRENNGWKRKFRYFCPHEQVVWFTFSCWIDWLSPTIGHNCANYDRQLSHLECIPDQGTGYNREGWCTMNFEMKKY